MALPVPDIATTPSDPDTARVAPYVEGDWADVPVACGGSGTSAVRPLVVSRHFVVNPPAPKKDLLAQLSVVHTQMRQAAADQGLDLDQLVAGAALHFTNGSLPARLGEGLTEEQLLKLAESDLAEFRE
ncbi:MAG TPA: hypothetical protein VF170_01230 [Planctomycetaceae bacterium]